MTFSIAGICLSIILLFARYSHSYSFPVCNSGVTKPDSSCLLIDSGNALQSTAKARNAMPFTTRVSGLNFSIDSRYTKPDPELSSFGKLTEKIPHARVYPFTVHNDSKPGQPIFYNILLFSLSEKFYPSVAIYEKVHSQGSTPEYHLVKAKYDTVPDKQRPRGLRVFELKDTSQYLAIVAPSLADAMPSPNPTGDFIIHFTANLEQLWAPLDQQKLVGLDHEKAHHKNEWARYEMEVGSDKRAELSAVHKSAFKRKHAFHGIFNPHFYYINPNTKSLRFYWTHGEKAGCNSPRRNAAELIPVAYFGKGGEKGDDVELKDGSSNFPDHCLYNIRFRSDKFAKFVELVLSSSHHQ